MKIMIVLSVMFGGGAERVATLWANSFADAGHEVVFASDVVRSDDPLLYPINESVTLVKCFGFHNEPPVGWKSIVLKYVPIIYEGAKRIRELFSAYFHLRKVIKSFRPDFVLGVMLPVSNLALFASFGSLCQVIATDHNAYERPPCAPMSIIVKFFKFTAGKWFDAVTVLTEADYKCTIGKLTNVHVMPNPLSLTPIKGGFAKKKRIVAAGRLDVWHSKGFDILIKAWGMIADKYPDWTLEIAGRAGLKPDETLPFLNNLIDENKVRGKCILSGFHSDMAEFFRESEIFVLSSRYEGFGLVLIEAMSQGCACIACDFRGRQREIIRDESEGMCIPPEDEKVLADAMERMINDQEYRNMVQHNAPKRAADYSPEIIERKWEDLFNHLRNNRCLYRQR